MCTTLLQLRVTEIGGSMTRDVVAKEEMSMFNLHRALQYCVKPRQSDSTIDGKAYVFRDAKSNTVIKGPKSAQLYRNNCYNAANIGDRYIYEYDEGKKKMRFTVEIIDTIAGDARYEVPRCTGGSNGSKPVDLDIINKKLLIRRFTKSRAGQFKKTRGFWCPASATNEDLMRAHMYYMQKGL